jgi:four helix bundle protein
MEGFHTKLRKNIVAYILLGYKSLKKFPKEEQFAMTSQCRRALVSILLNYTEGYARKRPKVTTNFYEISYGSLQETSSIFYLAVQLKYIDKALYLSLHEKKEEIAKMLWATIESIKQK